MQDTHSDLDGLLLDRIQRSIPFTSEPFADLAKELDISEETCLARLKILRDEQGIIRQISAIFDTQSLGYKSSLVAARYEPDQLEAAAAIVSGHPGVSHNYQRDHDFNLWYTLAVSPSSSLGLQATADKLHALSGAQSTRLLPTLKLYKIGVKLKMHASATAPASPSPTSFTHKDRAEAGQYTLTDADRKMVVVLQQDIPLISRPFELWAQQAQCTEAELIAACKRFSERKQMRRFSAVLRHRKAGFGANAMGVWPCPEDQIDVIGPLCATFDEVSHCYHRPSYKDLPYTLYTMVHGRSHEDAIAILERIQEATGLPYFKALWSTREFKKVRVQYFTPDEAAWEAQH